MKFFLLKRSGYYFFYNKLYSKLLIKRTSGYFKNGLINFLVPLNKDNCLFFFFTHRWIFFRFSKFRSLNFLLYDRLSFDVKFLYLKIFKAHGINMRVAYVKKKNKTNLLFLRLGFSHGLLLKLPKTFLFRIYKRRYFLISTIDLCVLNNLVFQLRNFRRFFRYKLIGLKLNRDFFRLKIGKKKTF